MRKVVLGVGISLDGYIARPDGSVDFLFMPKDYSMGPFFKRIDAAVMGRKSYEMGLKLGGGEVEQLWNEVLRLFEDARQCSARGLRHREGGTEIIYRGIEEREGQRHLVDGRRRIDAGILA